MCVNSTSWSYNPLYKPTSTMPLVFKIRARAKASLKGILQKRAGAVHAIILIRWVTTTKKPIVIDDFVEKTKERSAFITLQVTNIGRKKHVPKK